MQEKFSGSGNFSMSCGLIFGEFRPTMDQFSLLSAAKRSWEVSLLLSGDPQNHNEIWLRWTDSAASCSREERVTLIDTHETEVVLCSRIPFDSRTGVSLVVGGDSESGTVIACRPDQEHFILIIQMVPFGYLPKSVDRDPGVLAVDDFLTEEQERLLLEEIESEWRGCGTNTRATAN